MAREKILIVYARRERSWLHHVTSRLRAIGDVNVESAVCAGKKKRLSTKIGTCVAGHGAGAPLFGVGGAGEYRANFRLVACCNQEGSTASGARQPERTVWRYSRQS